MNSNYEIVPLRSLDLGAVLTLNNLHALELSWLDLAQLESLVESAVYAFGVAPASAFVIALDQSAAYENFNFNWFRERYDRFLYVDRIAVDTSLRGSGVARALYSHLFEYARANQHSLIVCEVNLDPPNPKSLDFHKRMGFEEVGQASIPSRKRVAYLARILQ